MSIPNLSNLYDHVGSGEGGKLLFNHVSLLGGGKDECKKHVEPFKAKSPDAVKTNNCAINGYLMFKAIEGARKEIDEKTGTKNDLNYRGKLVNLKVEETTVVMNPLLIRSSAAKDRHFEFEFHNKEWIEKSFPLICSRGKHLDAVTWEDYGEELAKITEWYFLDTENGRGHLFVQLLDTPKHKGDMNMPIEGAFGGRYLYIALVCASGGMGYGKYLMKVAEAMSRALGCDGIALASLSNSAGFYYSLGYRFMNKMDGMPIDVSAWTHRGEEASKEGRFKLVLNPDIYANPDIDTNPEQPQKREREHEPEREYGMAEETATKRSRLETMYYEAIKKAQVIYSRLSALSFEQGPVL
jgi:GNAT superfamily N-acetyltransferase